MKVLCTYTDTSGNPVQIEQELKVDVQTVCVPSILGASSIQKCCLEVVSYCVDFECDADQYQWEVTNATIVDGQGTSCIDIQPNLLGVVELSCTVSRANGHPDYTRVHSMNVSRFNPLTPAIIKPGNFICADSTLTLSVERICGLDYISWNLPPQLEIIWSNEDSTQIEVGVVNAVSPVIGKGVTFGAEAILNNACNLNAGEVVDSLLIYTAEVPPLPVGGISLRPFPEGEEDSCQIVAWEIIFEGNPPYENGTTTVFPTNIPNLPHKANEDSISIEVCNENACSNLESCTTFVIAAPPYCEGEIFGRADEGGFEEMSRPKEQIAREVISRKDDGGVLPGAIWIYPNPFRENLKIILPKPGSWQFELFNVHGVMIERQSAELKMRQWDIGNYVRNIPSGTYYLRVTGGKESIVQKLIKL